MPVSGAVCAAPCARATPPEASVAIITPSTSLIRSSPRLRADAEHEAPFRGDKRHVFEVEPDHARPRVPRGICRVTVAVHPVDRLLLAQAAVEEVEDLQRVERRILEADARVRHEHLDVP